MKTFVGRKLSVTERKEANARVNRNPSVFRHLWKSTLGLGLMALTVGVVVLI
jgi:hypothetical protein